MAPNGASLIIDGFEIRLALWCGISVIVHENWLSHERFVVLTFIESSPTCAGRGRSPVIRRRACGRFAWSALVCGNFVSLFAMASIVKVSVTVYNNDVEQGIRALKKSCRREGVYKKLRDKLYYMSRREILKKKGEESSKRHARKWRDKMSNT